MRLCVKETKEEAARWVEARLASELSSFKSSPEKPYFILGLPTGSTPIPVYQGLIRRFREQRLSFQQVQTFNMDEYVGLDEQQEQSYAAFMKEQLFEAIDLPPAQRHLLPGVSEDPEAACASYEALIRHYGGIDLQLCGVGEDGHLAFNEPFSSFASPTRIVWLTPKTRAANARFFGGRVEAVPRAALTIGMQLLREAKSLLILAVGKKKAPAVAAAVEGAVTHACPLSLVQLHPDATLVCDQEAASLLREETHQYFAEAWEAQDE